MNTNFRKLLAIFSLFALIAADIPSVPAAAPNDEGSQKQDKRDGPRNRRAPGGRITRPGEHIRNHTGVRMAFTSVVRVPRQSTVAVLSNGNRIALGTIVDANGLILTKASQLGESTECALVDGRKFEAKVIGTHKDSDLAMLKIDVQGLEVIQWQDGDSPIVGSFLATPGTTSIPHAIGVVSNAPREIPSPPGILGILLEEDERGPRIDQVLPDSAAEKAGLRVNDIVVSVNGKDVGKRDELIRTVQQYKAGDKLKLAILRGEERKEVPATLGDRMNLTEEGRRGIFQNTLGGRLSKRRSGFPSAIQHDTVLKPEDCGGPIVNLDGKAIGINIARSGRVDSLALPFSVIKPIIEELKAGKHAPISVGSD